MSAPRWLYLHGFASGPQSTKGLALARHYAALGIELQRLDLRRPSLEHLRLGAGMDVELSRAFARGKRHVELVEVDDGHELTVSLPIIQREADRFLAPFLAGR